MDIPTISSPPIPPKTNDDFLVFVLAYLAREGRAHWTDIFAEYAKDANSLYHVPDNAVGTLKLLQNNGFVDQDQHGYYTLAIDLTGLDK